MEEYKAEEKRLKWMIMLTLAVVVMPILVIANMAIADDDTGPMGPKKPVKTPVQVHQDRVHIVYFNEYDQLYKDCGVSKCCRASVRAIRKKKVNPDYVSNQASIKCPAGFKKASLRCPASMIWCESPHKVPEGDGSGKKSSKY